MERETMDRKKITKILYIAVASVLLLAGILCAILIPLLGNKPLTEMEFLQKALVKKWHEVPITVQNKIEIASADGILVTYNNKYIIQDDTKNAGFWVETVYFNDNQHELNSKEEYYLANNKIYLQSENKDGVTNYSYAGNMKIFKEIILDQADKYYTFQHNYAYISDFQYEQFDDRTRIFMAIKDENVKDFLGDNSLGVKNLIYDFIILRNGNIVNSLVSYDSISDEKVINTKIESTVEYKGVVSLPEWVK